MKTTIIRTSRLAVILRMAKIEAKRNAINCAPCEKISYIQLAAECEDLARKFILAESLETSGDMIIIKGEA